jgi:hypothetical protein
MRASSRLNTDAPEFRIDEYHRGMAREASESNKGTAEEEGSEDDGCSEGEDGDGAEENEDMEETEEVVVGGNEEMCEMDVDKVDSEQEEVNIVMVDGMDGMPENGGH